MKIFDFGISKYMTKGPNTKNCVTRCYRPPEIFFGDRNYTFKVDIWSAACTLYELMTGKILFQGTSDIEVVAKIFEVLGTPKDWPEVEDLPCYLPFADSVGSGLSDIESEEIKEILYKML